MTTVKIDEPRVRRIIHDAFSKAAETSIDHTDGFTSAVRALVDEFGCTPSTARYWVQQFGGDN